MTEEFTVAAVRFEIELFGVRYAQLFGSLFSAVRGWARSVAHDGGDGGDGGADSAAPLAVSATKAARSLDGTVIAAAYDASTGVRTLFNMSAAVNTGGNAYGSSADFLTALGWGGAVSAGKGAASGKSSRAQSRRQRRLFSLEFDVKDTRGDDTKGVALQLALDGSFSRDPPASNSTPRGSTVIVFNVLTSSTEDAMAIRARLVASLTSAASKLDAQLNSMLSRRLLSSAFDEAPPGNISTVVNAESVALVELNLTRSFWGVFLEWLRKNVLYVVFGCSGAAGLFFIVICLRPIKKMLARIRRLATMKSALLQQSALTMQLKKSSLKARVRRLLRRFGYVVYLVRRVLGRVERPDSGTPAGGVSPVKTALVSSPVDGASANVIADSLIVALEAQLPTNPYTTITVAAPERQSAQVAKKKETALSSARSKFKALANAGRAALNLEDLRKPLQLMKERLARIAKADTLAATLPAEALPQDREAAAAADGALSHHP